MERIKMIIMYDGTDFAGYQVQINQRTVQQVIERALRKMHKQDVRIFSSGRTDSGVHAMGQVIHFDSHLELDEPTWKHALMTLLPSDIRIIEVEKVSQDFHARKDASHKTYLYQIRNAKEHEVFARNFEWHIPRALDVDRMQEAAPLMEGTHDFTAFAASKTNVKGDKTRTIHEVKVLKEGSHIFIEVTGDGFLTHMVRIMVGTLVEIGIRKKDPKCISEALSTNERHKLGLTAPGHGLYLKKVAYEKGKTEH
ncbi:tRNA pseudouridine(38-40) synthase TruA [Halalkalibacillus sediminis]|uniref:tRNA pseudouridine synthase A n=1 Tax=Halalkalibacillus sediminis TaxID=2018042 RepID=A0A2I0QQF5_9BACI|nr:tRNA pseudouridine(38-40) synthase TruA [Halalkalibacillus sediminis]PKR76564.1 tRNA pseudouridine(38-40) synthase TruA [Halalkalibacillus sediminis]